MKYINAKIKTINTLTEYPVRQAYNNRTQKFWESSLFSVKYIWFKFHQNLRYWIGVGWGGVGWGGVGLHVTCDAHFLTFPSYSSQKSRVKTIPLEKLFRAVDKKKKNLEKLFRAVD